MSQPIRAEDVFASATRGGHEVPIWLLGKEALPGALDAMQKQWAKAQRFKGTARQQVLLPGADGRLAGVLLGMGDGAAGEPSGPSELLLGQLAQSLPAGSYRLESGLGDPNLAAIAWGLGAYRFTTYKNAEQADPARLRIPAGADRKGVLHTVEAVWRGRDLINTPASDLGPADLAAAARELAEQSGGRCKIIEADRLLADNFPLIHAVGRASTRPPCLIDIAWGREGAPKVTLIGKGICFDTGGLDIKPASGMLLMKKDMGGAAAALTLARLIVANKLDVRLRVLIPAADNSISGDAFRPGDVLKSRAGATVEIGNTDAEGRLVLADAIALADEEAPECIIVLATLTGAARVALGPDLPALFSDDDAFCSRLVAQGAAIGDPVWRLPLWTGYESKLDSPVADMNNIWEAPFAGAIVAALFLRRFAKRARRFVHLDIYGWRPSATALGPKGGEPQAARALLAALEKEYAR